MIGLLGEKNLVYQFELQPAYDMNILCYVILGDKTEIRFLVELLKWVFDCFKMKLHMWSGV